MTDTDWKSNALAIVSQRDVLGLHDGKIYRLSGGRAFATNGCRALIINSFGGNAKEGGRDIEGAISPLPKIWFNLNAGTVQTWAKHGTRTELYCDSCGKDTKLANCAACRGNGYCGHCNADCDRCDGTGKRKCLNHRPMTHVSRGWTPTIDAGIGIDAGQVYDVMCALPGERVRVARDSQKLFVKTDEWMLVVMMKVDVVTGPSLVFLAQTAGLRKRALDWFRVAA